DARTRALFLDRIDAIVAAPDGRSFHVHAAAEARDTGRSAFTLRDADVTALRRAATTRFLIRLRLWLEESYGAPSDRCTGAP
ncbi:hypothetical protein, partial [Escherichia coli]